MRWITNFIIFLLCFITTFSHELSNVFEKVKNANVTIYKRIGGKLKQYRSIGSGFIVNSERGLVMTCAHVLKSQKDREYDAFSIPIGLFDGRRVYAKVVMINVSRDIAMIQIQEGYNVKLPLKMSYQVRFADSSRIIPGQSVMAIGNPSIFGKSVTRGIVSATNKIIVMPAPTTYENMIMHDNLIMGGNSGGALYNHNGEVIGMTSILAQDDSFAYSINSNILKQSYEQWMREGNVYYPILGVQIGVPGDKDFRKNKLDQLGYAPPGVIVLNVYKGSFAEKNKMKRGDIITHIDDRLVTSSKVARGYLAEYTSRSVAKITYVRDSKSYTIRGKLPDGFYDLRLDDVQTADPIDKPDILDGLPFPKKKKRHKKIFDPLKDLPKGISEGEKIEEVNRRAMRAFLGEWSLKSTREKLQGDRRSLEQNLYLEYLFLRQNNL